MGAIYIIIEFCVNVTGDCCKFRGHEEENITWGIQGNR